MCVRVWMYTTPISWEFENGFQPYQHTAMKTRSEPLASVGSRPKQRRRPRWNHGGVADHLSDLLEASAHRFQNSGIGFVLVEHGGTVSNSRRWGFWICKPKITTGNIRKPCCWHCGGYPNKLGWHSGICLTWRNTKKKKVFQIAG